ncbi:hypothetical protein C2869_18210 [Saccharobesus litoralis]|uniref:PrcB C-terminal domain-containing protein n=1 Tax=Saccharobesus litoralis TaxID=2172099 RepID=A0A2S0VVI0_9ALTE|nr:protease complex subunit PrcB family protein [Saccharobesus litoralis]AWB68227.1 hypothetical protein C2869_18210 [Saccharobesus litoralis]
MTHKILATLLAFLVVACHSNDNGRNKEKAKENEEIPNALETAVKQGLIQVIKCPAVAGYTTMEVETKQVITDENNYLHVFANSDLNLDETPPTIDFTQQQVVALHLGLKPSSGYKLEFDNFVVKASTLNIYYTEVSPPILCDVTQAITYPYCLIAVNNQFTNIEFFKSDKQQCSR